MEKELPSFDYSSGEAQFARPLPAAPEQELETPEDEEASEIENYVRRVARLMRENGDSKSEACEKVFNTDRLSESKREVLRSEIGRILGRRGGKKAAEAKAQTKRHRLPEKQAFTPAQTEKMIKGAKELQAAEEKRAGDSYDDLELG